MPRYKPGIYPFTITDAEKRSGDNAFKTGSMGWTLTMEVSTPDGLLVCRYVHLVFSPRALFKFEQFENSTGVLLYDGEKPLVRDPEDIVGLTGWAKFDHNKKGYLEPVEFVSGDKDDDEPEQAEDW